MNAKYFRIRSSLRKFIELESFSSIVLLSGAILAMIFANTTLSDFYQQFIHYHFLGLSINHWVNDGLMTIFFFVVGLELKKEIVQGELSNPKKTALPIFAAIGGMIVPALIYSAFNLSGDYKSGWGIPMATDIAFALGALSLFGKKIPLSLKVFLLSIAIVDDLGAIVVIALFYTSKINSNALMTALLLFVVLYFLKRKHIKNYFIYTLLGAAIWLAVFRSGIHATIAGVLLGLFTPFEIETKPGSLDTYSPIEELINFLHPFVSFIILPIFAFANSGINLLSINFSQLISSPIHLGILFGLTVGKPLGIILFCFIAVKMKLATLTLGMRWKDVFGISLLAGIGFTMSLFISDLALPAEVHIYSKSAIVFASILSALFGIAIIYRNSKNENNSTP